MTSAPMSARYIEAVGAAYDDEMSTTRTPCSGPVAAHVLNPFGSPGRVVQDVLEVLVHRLRGIARRAAADGVEDRDVLLDRGPADLRRHGEKPGREGRLVDCRDERGEQPVARGLGDRHVEVTVVRPRCRGRRSSSSSDGRRCLAARRPAGPGGVRAAQDAAGTSSTRRIEVSSSMSSDPSRTIVSIDSLSIALSESGRDAVDEAAAGDPWDLSDQTGSDERPQGLPHGRATHAELLGQLRLRRQLVALAELTPKDRLSDLLLHLRARSQDLPGPKRLARQRPVRLS